MEMPKRLSDRLAVLASPAFILALLCCLAPLAAEAGPPYLTDDPDPVDYGHLEAIPFYALDRAGDGSQIQGPGADISYGIAPDMHLNLVPVFIRALPDGGPSESGLGDFRVALKWRFLEETDSRPAVAFYPAVTFPTGSAARGLGNGQASYQFPLWLEKNWGAWSSYGGGGWTLNRAPGARDYWFGGWQAQKQLDDTWNLGGELFAQGRSADAAAGFTALNLGGSMKLTESASLVFTFGHSFAGASHRLAYIGVALEW